MVDDASPDGTQEVVKQVAKIYGDDRIVCQDPSSITCYY